MAEDLDLSIGAPSGQRADGAVLRSIALDQEPPDDPAAAGPAGEPPMVDEWMVRGVTRSIMEGTLGLLLGDPDAPDLWDFTDKELDELVPPLTRIINRRPALRAAVIRGDEAVVAVVMARYLGRNFAERRRVRRARDEIESGQVPGGPGPVGVDAARAAGPDQPGGPGGLGVHPTAH